MKTNIIHKRFADLSMTMRDNLYKFTLRSFSYMQDSMDQIPDEIDTFIIRHRNKILGWGLVRKERSQLLLMIYIAKENRRQGFATEIVRAVKKVKKYRNISMAPWDDQSLKVVESLHKRRFKLGVISV
jgi:hypothetical protein